MKAAGANAGGRAAGSGDASRRSSLFRAIPRGRRNAIPQAELAAELGISTRSLQQSIKRSIELEGWPVASACSPPYGVFVPESPDELEAAVDQLRNRAVSLCRRIAALNHAAAETLLCDQQEEIGAPGPNLRVGEAVCPVCREAFRPKRSTQVYCRPECRYRAAKLRGSI